MTKYKLQVRERQMEKINKIGWIVFTSSVTAMFFIFILGVLDG